MLNSSPGALLETFDVLIVNTSSFLLAHQSFFLGGFFIITFTFSCLGGFFIARRVTFQTLQNLVAHYTRDADGLCVNLRKACSKAETPQTVGLSYNTSGGAGKRERYIAKLIAAPLFAITTHDTKYPTNLAAKCNNARATVPINMRYNRNLLM